MRNLLLLAVIGLIWDLSPTQDVREYRVYEQTNGVWIYRVSSTSNKASVTANKGTRTYAVTAVNNSGESPRSASVSVRIKH